MGTWFKWGSSPPSCNITSMGTWCKLGKKIPPAIVSERDFVLEQAVGPGVLQTFSTCAVKQINKYKLSPFGVLRDNESLSSVPMDIDA